MKPLTAMLFALLMFCGYNSNSQSPEVIQLIEKANKQLDAGEKQLAKITIEKAYLLESKNTEVLTLKGFIHFELEEYDLAVSAYNELLEIDDKNGEAFYYRAMAYIGLNKSEKACEDFTKAKELGYKLARIQHQQFCM